jgi:hypothetical protein
MIGVPRRLSGKVESISVEQLQIEGQTRGTTEHQLEGAKPDAINHTEAKLSQQQHRATRHPYDHDDLLVFVTLLKLVKDPATTGTMSQDATCT